MPPVYTPREICSNAGIPSVRRLWVTRPAMPIIAARPLWSSLVCKRNRQKLRVETQSACEGAGEGGVQLAQRATHPRPGKQQHDFSRLVVYEVSYNTASSKIKIPTLRRGALWGKDCVGGSVNTGDCPTSSEPDETKSTLSPQK